MPVRLSRSLPVCLAIVAAATSCAPPESRPRTPLTVDSPPSSQAATTVEPSDVGMPLLFVETQHAELSWTLDVLLNPVVQGCMTDLGFDYKIPSPVRPAPYGIDGGLKRRYLWPIQMPDGRFAYAFAEGGDDHNAATDDGAQSNPSPEFIRALTGEEILSKVVYDPNGAQVSRISVGDGCGGQAAVQVFGSAEDYVNFYSALNSLEALAAWTAYELRSSEAMASIDHSWSDCMARAGYSYESIFDPMNSDWPSPRPSPREIAVAGADAACRERLVPVEDVAAVEAAVQVAYIESHPGVVEQIEAVKAKIHSLVVDAESRA